MRGCTACGICAAAPIPRLPQRISFICSGSACHDGYLPIPADSQISLRPPHHRCLYFCNLAPLSATSPCYLFLETPMPLVAIKTASETGYCDCVCGCYELASQRDEDTGKGYCPACAKNHLDWNA